MLKTKYTLSILIILAICPCFRAYANAKLERLTRENLFMLLHSSMHGWVYVLDIFSDNNFTGTAVCHHMPQCLLF